MKEKLEKKINEEIDKAIKRDDFTLEEIRTMIEIKNNIELREMLKESFGSTFAISMEKGE